MLDARKIARIVANRARVTQGRTRTVTLVYNRPEGTTYAAAAVVWSPQQYSEPQTAYGPTPAAHEIDVVAEFPLSVDPSLASLVADTPTATAAGVSAPGVLRYEVVSSRLAGLIPNRYMVHLARIR